MAIINIWSSEDYDIPHVQKHPPTDRWKHPPTDRFPGKQSGPLVALYKNGDQLVLANKRIAKKDDTSSIDDSDNALPILILLTTINFTSGYVRHH
jgi:hypothetical protein